MDLKQLQDLLFKEYVRNGYLSMWNNVKPSEIGDIAELGLIVTEVSEAIEKIRNDQIGLVEEIADIVIRVLNFATRKDIDVEKAIFWKNKINLERGKLHGKVI